LVGLENKQAAMDDLQKDLEENQKMVRETDEARQELQMKFVLTS